MTTNGLDDEKQAYLRERLRELSEFIPLERLNGAFENIATFQNAMTWETALSLIHI